MRRPAVAASVAGLVFLAATTAPADESYGGKYWVEVASGERAAARRSSAALPAPAEGDDAGSEPVLRADLLQRMDGLLVVMADLLRLRADSADGECYLTDLPAAKGLLSDLAGDRDAYSKAVAAYYPMNIKAQGGFLGRTTSRDGTAASPLDLDLFFKRASAVESATNEALDHFTSCYNHALHMTRSRRRVPWAAAAALLAMGALAWRRRSRPAAPTPEPAMPAPGSPTPAPGGPLLAGNYQVERELGRGGMGVVVQALDIALQRRVAIKRVRGDFAPDPRDAEQFLAEARLVAALQHPNIVKIHTFFREGAELCLVFELLEGKPLSSRLAGGHALALTEVRAILRQGAAALDYAHANKVIHRDLKPANIMLTPAGLVKVMDFGLAHQARHTAAQMTRAAAGGTFPYMAPEQELGEVCRQSDVFALGVCLYEMLTGRLPFEGPNFLAQKREKRCLPPSKVQVGLPAALDAALARSLDPDPAARFDSAAELAAAVDAA